MIRLFLIRLHHESGCSVTFYACRQSCKRNGRMPVLKSWSLFANGKSSSLQSSLWVTKQSETDGSSTSKLPFCMANLMRKSIWNNLRVSRLKARSIRYYVSAEQYMG